MLFPTGRADTEVCPYMINDLATRINLKEADVPVHQVPLQRWPSGDSKDLAELRLSPEELGRRYGLSFEELHDDLDDFRVAAIALPDGSNLWLYRYRHEPEPGTAVRVDAAADFRKAKAQLAQVLGLTADDFLWVSPLVEAPAQPAG